MQERIRYIRLFFIITVFGILIRLGYWQLVQSDNLAARAESQRTITHELLAPRGDILFSDGSVLASTQPTYTVFTQPKFIDENFKDKQGLGDFKKYYAQRLAEQFTSFEATSDATTEAQKKDELQARVDSIYNKLNKDLFWVNLNQTVTYEQKTQLQKLNLLGLGFDPNSQRFYPEGSSSAHLLGFVGSDIYGEPQGYLGLEGYYDRELKGVKGEASEETDAQGVPILIGEYKNREAKPGKTFLLNIDRSIQYIVEKELKAGMDKYQAKGGSAVVMDPKTGAVLAMAAYPNYDPSHVQDFPVENFKNPVVADTYEPGSTFKVLVMAAAINEGVVNRDTICDTCSGPVQIGQYAIRTWNDQYFPDSTMDDVLIHSDNTGMVFVSRKLGLDKLYQYIQNFGIGKETGIDLQDEVSTKLRDKNDWKEIDQATASFGQGISVTPIQIVRAVSTIANGGKLMEPHVVSKITDGKETFTIEPKVVSQPISEKTAETVKQMMIRAVNEGESKFAKPKGYTIAGKTGTAQIPVAGHYDPTKTIASFVGFAPVDDPKFVMLVKFDEPKSSIFGAETAAPVFFNIAKELFTYYGISPDNAQ